jgi:hypothetical protein
MRTRKRTIFCSHGEPACYVGLLDETGDQVVRPLWIRNLDVIDQVRADRQQPGDQRTFISAHGCHFTDPGTA